MRTRICIFIWINYSYEYNSWSFAILCKNDYSYYGKLSTVEMATLTLTWNCMEDSEEMRENFGLDETILGSRNEISIT